MRHYRDIVGLKIVNALSEFVLVIISYLISGLIRYYLGADVIQEFALSDIWSFFPFAIITGIMVVLGYTICGDYSTIRVRSVRKELTRVLIIQSICGIMSAGILFLMHGGQFSRVMLVMFIAISIIAILIKRIVFSIISIYWCRKHQGLGKVLIVGSGNYARRYYRGIEKVNNKDCIYVGNVSPEADKAVPMYLGTYDSIGDIIDRTGADEAVIVEELNQKQLNEILITCALKNVMVYIIPPYNDYLSEGRILSTYGDLNMIAVNALSIDNILGVNIAVTTMEKTIQDITDKLNEWRGQYICVSNVHTTIMAHENPEYMKIQNDAVMALPDGSPLSSYSRESGKSMAKRVTGPDLMKEILMRSGENHWKHFFYGSTEDTLKMLKEKLTERYPEAEIVGMISPPFREITEEEDAEYIKKINDAAPDFVWVGLGAPKQEIWMAAHKGKINALMIGVGAAFDFESGNIKRAPKWMQDMKLEWLYRMMQDPKRLFKRYFVTNIKYLWLTKK